MGRTALLDAVVALLNADSPPADQAYAYLVIIQMIPEAMRFNPILEHIVHLDPLAGYNVHWRDGAPLTRDMITLQNHWRTISDAVLWDDQGDTESSDYNVALVNRQLDEPQGLAGLLSCVALLLWSSNQAGYNPGPGPSGLGKRDVGFLAARATKNPINSPVPKDGWIPKGHDMFQILEVDAVVKGQNWLRAYGEGWVYTELEGSVPQNFFDHKEELYCQVIGNVNTKTGGSLAVAQALYAAGHISVVGDLSSYNIVGLDNKITTSDSTIEWDARDTDFNVYDEVQTARLSGKDGYADVKYVVMTNARKVGISIAALDIDGQNSIYMYGQINATATLLGESHTFGLYRIEDRPEIHWTIEKGAEVSGPWTLAIPMKQKKVQIDLSLYRSRTLLADKLLIHDSVTLSPESRSATLKGENGKFRIDTTWD
ncbi:hypothetical protein TWF696_007675 [Orbilia brochopaga]|uniref:DUF6598 domain-containing protein n=1 Tax=Orbilia brochopaga TaxID=3140254 RepID=A0AAV9UQC5_9PEZI